MTGLHPDLPVVSGDPLSLCVCYQGDLEPCLGPLGLDYFLIAIALDSDTVFSPLILLNFVNSELINPECLNARMLVDILIYMTRCDVKFPYLGQIIFKSDKHGILSFTSRTFIFSKLYLFTLFDRPKDRNYLVPNLLLDV